MTGHNGKIFSCTAQGRIKIGAILEIKNCFSISYNKKINFKFIPNHIFYFPTFKN